MGFFTEAKSDLSTAEGAEGMESMDLDSMLDKLDGAEETLAAAEEAPQTVADALSQAEEAPQGPSENEAGSDDEFLSKLSQALSTAGMEETPAQDAVPEQPVPETPIDTPQESSFGAAIVPDPVEDVPQDFGAATSFDAPAQAEAAAETTETAFAATEGGFQMDMQITQPATDENAVITAGMMISGDVVTSGNLELMGKVAGNVKASGKLTISGEINGDSSAAEIYAENARINGQVQSQGSVKVGQATVIIGNIAANGAVIAGAVKGDIDVHGPVILDTTAIVMGNIKSQSVQINNGAVIEGMCSQVYAEVNPSAFFDNLK